MLNKLEQAAEKFSGSHDIIDTWLDERKQLLVQYCQLAGLPPFEKAENAFPESDSIESFCEILMDYISAGHFEMYDKILAECDADSNAQKLAEELYPQISSTTDAALTFNDSFANLSENDDLSKFDISLAQLGQQMEERFELEDRLIGTLVKS